MALSSGEDGHRGHDRGGAATSAGFNGIDPERLEQAAAALRDGADRLAVLGEELGGKLHRYGIGTAAPREIIRIADRGRTGVSKLRERAELIRKLNEGGVKSGEFDPLT